MLIKELESILADFWWSSPNEKKIHWISWTKLCESKQSGGMGFRDLEAFNLALVSKQVWRILKNPDTLLSKILKGRYFARGSIFEARLGFNPSSTWRSIWRTIPLVKAGCRWRVGDGSNIQIWVPVAA
ncbi:UNVERIFIED_CONTAM: putative mitochondrial protein [Sesamum radiatum]|uniref:Mitochondrial protein n=1 Tax=Sesamum radiatum TaxID=300843 RepID=A0AAW2TXN3_SESRA